MENLLFKVYCVMTASLFTVKAGHLGGGGNSLSSSYGVPSFGDGGGGAITSSYHIPSSSYGTPSGGGFGGHGGGYDNGGYSGGGHGGHGGHEQYEQPKPYEFGYSVKDPHTGSDFKQQESSDGNTVKGQYKVHLPDGRIQIVTYTADWQTGFHADVKYEGEAIYPSNYGHGGHGGYGGGGSSTYGVPSGGYSGGGGDYSGGGGVATGTAYNTLGYSGHGNGGGHGDFSGGNQQYGVPGY